MVIHHREVHVVVQAQPRADAHVALGPHVILLVTLVAHAVNAVLVVEAPRDIVVGILAAARYAEGVFVGIIDILIKGLRPVGIAEILVFAGVVDAYAFERRILAAACKFPVPRVGIRNNVVDRGIELLRAVVITVPGIDIARRPLVAVGHEVGLHGTRMDRETTVIGDVHLALGSRFGRHEDHAERTAGTVDGGRRGVLEHRHAGDVLRVDRLEVTLNAVDQHQRTAARADRPRTADVDRRGTRRLAVAHRNVEVGNGTLQRTRNARVGAFGELPAVHLVDGADQVAALDGAVTHDDDLFEDLLVFTQGHIECAPGTDRLFGGLEAQVHEDERRIVPGKRERIPAVGIGRRTHDGVLHQYTHAGQRLAGLIGDTAHDGMFPLQRGFGSRCRGGRGGCRQGDHLILDFIRDARACEDRGKHFVERRAVQCDIHIGHRTLPERRFIGKDHARLPGKSRDDLAQRGTAERQLQVVALCGESGTGIRRSERRKREAGA